MRFDHKGNITNEISYFEGEIDHEFRWHYSPKGLASRKEYFNDGRLKEVSVFEHEVSENNIKKRREVLVGSPIKETIETTFDNRLIRVEYFADQTITKEEQYVFDDEMRLVSEEWRSFTKRVNPTPRGKEQYEYDREGILSRQTTFGLDGKIVGIASPKLLKFDSHGNCTEELVGANTIKRMTFSYYKD
ncbi:hypothetical protein [Fulvitalea axinellae]